MLVKRLASDGFFRQIGGKKVPSFNTVGFGFCLLDLILNIIDSRLMILFKKKKYLGSTIGYTVFRMFFLWRVFDVVLISLFV
jgi:hypothetical protein